MNTPQEKYSIEHLVNLVNLLTHLTGEKPKTLELSPDFYTWYVQSAQEMADAYNLTRGFIGGKVLFNGVELVKKAPRVNIETV